MQTAFSTPLFYIQCVSIVRHSGQQFAPHRASSLILPGGLRRTRRHKSYRLLLHRSSTSLEPQRAVCQDPVVSYCFISSLLSFCAFAERAESAPKKTFELPCFRSATLVGEWNSVTPARCSSLGAQYHTATEIDTQISNRTLRVPSRFPT